MGPLNNEINPRYRLELSPALQGNLNPRRMELSVGMNLEWEGLRGGVTFLQDLITPDSSRSSFFFQLGYRYYLHPHHTLQLDAMVGGDVTGAQPGSTLYLLMPSYTWFPDSSQVWGLNFFARMGGEVFSTPLQGSPDFRGVWMGGLGAVFNWDFAETRENNPPRSRRPLDPQRCEEIWRLHHSTYSVTVIYLTEEAAQEAEDCLNQRRRN